MPTTGQLLALSLLLSLAGCPADVRKPEVRSLAQSPVVNPELTVAVDCALAHDGLLWAITSDGEINVGTGDQILSIPGAAEITFVRSHRVESDPGCLVGVRDSSGQWSLIAVADTDGDRVLDATSIQTLVSTGQQMFITDVLAVDGEPTTYALDRRCQDVYVLTDTDADGLPDHMTATPFAKSADYPALLDVTKLIGATANHVDLVVDSGDHANAHPRFGIDYVGEVKRAEDTNADGVADVVTTLTRTQASPSLWGVPYDGQDLVKVHGAEGLTIQLWSLKPGTASDDRGFVQDQVLASIVANGEWQSLSLTSALEEGDRVGLFFSGSADGVEHQVAPAGPQIVEKTGANLETTGGSFVVRGLGFDAQTVVKIATGEDYATETTLTTTFVAADELNVTYGPLGTGLVGDALLIVERVMPGGETRRAAVLTKVCLPGN